MTSPIGTIGTSTPTAGTTSTPSAGTESTIAQSKDMFLKLLIAQMKNQDPSNPTDSTQYLSQMASFTEVEKLQDLADSQASMLAATRLQSAVSMVGDTVAYGTGSAAGSGKVTGVTVIDGVAKLLIGQDKVDLADVTGVSAP